VNALSDNISIVNIHVFPDIIYIYNVDLQHLIYPVQWNLGSRTPLFTNNSVHEQIFRAKTSRMTNGVSEYEHASWQQSQAESIGAGVSVAG
jgi:hypothetical protein